jgi:RNA polymerase sigma-70 factor (ECF subfamily)
MTGNNPNITPVEQLETEQSLVCDIRNGKAKAFELLFKKYCQSLIYFSRRYVFDKQIAENIVQDVFAGIWQKRQHLDPSQSIKAYLFAAVKNESFKHLRHLDVEAKSYDRVVKLVNIERTPEEILDEKELKNRLNSAINELPEKCREIFFMSRFDGLKYTEIAEALGISVKTVETQMGRAFKKLREYLEPIITVILLIFKMLF